VVVALGGVERGEEEEEVDEENEDQEKNIFVIAEHC